MKVKKVARWMAIGLCIIALGFSAFAVTQWLVHLANPEVKMIGCTLAR